jgi:acetoacetyl-CoA synthetase
VTTREAIERVLSEELNLEPPPPGTDLISSGLLDSLAIVSLLVELEQRLDVQVPLGDLDLDDLRTVERIERLIDSTHPESTRSPAGVAEPGRADDGGPRVLVPIRAGHGRPLYLLHDSLGTAATAQPLAVVLETDRPVIAVQARGLDTRFEPQRTVEEMAAGYVREIRGHQPDGPYSLAGHSFGGLLAFEVARLLSAEGERVDLLALIDTEAHPRVLSGRAIIVFRLGQLAHVSRRLVSSPRHQLRDLIALLRDKRSKGRNLPEYLEARQLPARVKELKLLATAAEAAYRPGRFDGDALLFEAARRPFTQLRPSVVWRPRIRGRLRIVPLAGDHGTLFDAANLATMSRVLSEALDDGAEGQPASARVTLAGAPAALSERPGLH